MTVSHERTRAARRWVLVPLVALLSMMALGSLAPAQAAVPTESVGVAAYPPLSPAPYLPDCANTMRTPDRGGLACFNPTGEHLFICDTAGDGGHVTVWWQGTYDSVFTGTRNYNGYRTCVDANFEMPENTYIRYQVCVYDADRGNYASCADRTRWISARG